MALPGLHIDVRHGPFESRLDVDLIKRFAAATGDPNSRACAGESMPPVAMVTHVWEAQRVALGKIVNQELRRSASGGAHGEHDMVLHRPLVPGERLRSWVEGWGARPGGRHAIVTLHYSTFDERDELVVEQWWTIVYLNTTCDVAGRPPPDHTFPEDARSHPAATYDTYLDADLPRRYAEVSDDWAPIHFDIDAAHRNGWAHLSAHGLCTLALCSQGIVEQVAKGDPDRVRRLAARFAAPAYLDEELHVRVYDAGPRTYVFEAECAGATAVTNGRVELRA